MTLKRKKARIRIILIVVVFLRNQSFKCLKEQGVQSTDLVLLLDQNLKVLVDDSDGQENTSAAADRAQEVSQHRQSANAQTSEGGRRGDVPVELVNHRLVAVAGHDHLLLLQLLGHVLGTRAGHVDPGLGEEGARSQHEDDVDDSVEGVLQHRVEVLRRREVVAQAADWVGAGAAWTADIRPHAQQVDEEVAGELGGEHLRDDVEVGDKGGLEDDGDVAGVEELDWVAGGLAAEAGGLDGQVDAEALEVDDDAEDEDGGEQVGEVGQVLAVEGFFEGADFVVAGGEEVEEGDDGAFELCAAAGVDGGGREGFPDDGLADVGGDEEGDARAEAVAFLEELVEEEHDQAGDEQLHGRKSVVSLVNYSGWRLP